MSRKLEIKGILHARMGIIKDRNNKDLRGMEKIKKRWKGYLEELYIKGPNDRHNHNDVVTHLVRHPGVWNQMGLRKHYYRQT